MRRIQLFILAAASGGLALAGCAGPPPEPLPPGHPADPAATATPFEPPDGLLAPAATGSGEAR